MAVSLLVNSVGYITLSAIADSLFVSRATVINDLELIKKYVKAGNLEVLSHPNKGLRVDGLESDKRIFLMKLAGIRSAGKSKDMAAAGSKDSAVQQGIPGSYGAGAPAKVFVWGKTVPGSAGTGMGGCPQYA